MTDEKSELNYVRLGFLSTLFTIFSGLYFTLIKTINGIVLTRVEGQTADYTLYSIILTVLSFFVICYIPTIIYSLYLELSRMDKDFDQRKLNKKRDKAFEKVVLGIPTLFLSFIMSVLVILSTGLQSINLLGINIPPIITRLLYVLLIVSPFVLLYFQFANPISTKKGKIKLKKVKPDIGRIIIFALSLYLYFIFFTFFTSNVEINFDKNYYGEGDNLLVEIIPTGLAPPKIEMVGYSNKQYIIYNGTDQPFPTSRRYFKIQLDPEIKEPYNSFIIVIYRYSMTEKIPLLDRFGGHKTKIIPIYNDVELNETLR